VRQLRFTTGAASVTQSCIPSLPSATGQDAGSEWHRGLRVPAAFGRGGGASDAAVGAVAEIVVLGAHGGAGTTTLAALLAPAWDMGVVRRPSPGNSHLQTGGRPLVLVAGATGGDAGQAMAAVNALTWLGNTIAVLAVVSDGWPEPETARYRYRLLASRVGVIKRIPFIAALRATEQPALADLPRRVQRAITEIRAEALRVTSSVSVREP
jgi:hypothetical protein